MKFSNKIKKFGAILVTVLLISTIFLLNFVFSVSAEDVDSRLTFSGLTFGSSNSVAAVPNFNNSLGGNYGSASNVDYRFHWDDTAGTYYVNMYYAFDVPSSVSSFTIAVRPSSNATFQRIVAQDTKGTHHTLSSTASGEFHLGSYSGSAWMWSGVFTVQYVMPITKSPVNSGTWDQYIRATTLVEVTDNSGTNYSNILNSINDELSDIKGYLMDAAQLDPIDVWFGNYVAPHGITLSGSALNFTVHNNSGASGTLYYYLYNADSSWPTKFRSNMDGILYYYDSSLKQRTFGFSKGTLVTLPDDFYISFMCLFSVTINPTSSGSVPVLYGMVWDDDTGAVTGAANDKNNQAKDQISGHGQAESDINNVGSSGAGGISNEQAHSSVNDSTGSALTTYGYAFQAVTSFINDFIGSNDYLQTVLFWGLAVGVVPLIFGMSMHGLGLQHHYKTNAARREKFQAARLAEIRRNKK